MSNKLDGGSKNQENTANTSIYSKEESASKQQRNTNSVIPTFLRWFKKPNHRKSTYSQQFYSGRSAIESTSRYDSSSRESLTFYSSQNNKNKSNHLSPSISCDSVVSTSTTGFAFIRPNRYDGIYGNLVEPKILTDYQPDTDSIRRLQSTTPINNTETLVNQKPKLTLRQKYFLYESETPRSNTPISSQIYGNYDNINYLDSNSPNEEPIVPRRRRRQRRTVSDSSKDKKSGAYVHVKGKRKAPEPPTNLNNSEPTYNEIYSTPLRDNHRYRTLSPVSTFGRKKRKAPLPPKTSPIPLIRSSIEENKTELSESYDDRTESILSDGGLLDDKEIKEIIDRSGVGNINKFQDSSIYDTPRLLNNSRCNNIYERRKYENMISNNNQIVFNDDNNKVNESTISNKNAFKDELPKLNTESLPIKEIHKDDLNNSKSPTPPNSPISPRPWYKRSITTNRDSIIPFKREIVLKTMEKRKSKQKDSGETIFPEVSFSRSSIFDSGSKFNLFSRQKEPRSKDSKEKRLSSIGMPNISELDREAAEILMTESFARQTNWNENKSYNPPEHLKLQQDMFAVPMSEKSTDEQLNENFVNDNIDDAAQSAKELINKFESSTEGPKITLNTSFIGRTENFTEIKSKNFETNESIMKQEPSNIKNNENKPTEKNQTNSNTNQDDQADKKLTKLTWSCAFCTLENPNWRIICELCERLKPYDKQRDESNQIKEKSNPVNIINTKPSKPQQSDWDKKAEQVKKYFQESSGSPKKQPSILHKSPSPSRLPISSPKLGRQKFGLSEHQISQIQTNYNEPKKPLIDSSAVTTTITPVYMGNKTNKDVSINQSNKNDISNINLEQIRVARLAKFSVPLEPVKYSNTIEKENAISLFNDPNSLEMEKKRLREKIRAMNAKALAEKYPVIKKSLSLEEGQPETAISNPINITNSSDSINKITTAFKDKEYSPIKKTSFDSININYKENSPIRGDSIVAETNPSPSNNKSGAIKKILTKNIPITSDSKLLNNNQQSKSFEETYIYNKPNKVSSSSQTSGLVKKPVENSIKDSIDVTPMENKNFNNNFNYENKVLQTNESNEYVKLSDIDKDQVRVISQKLKSAEGRNDFKATLRNQGKGISRTDTLVLNKILRNLELAISEGKHELAAKLAMDLAKMKVSLQVTKLRPTKLAYSFDQEDSKSFIIDMFVEDRISQKGPIQISIKTSMTVRELKEKAFKDFNIPINIQRWLINDELLYNENHTLYECGVRNNLASLYLYLMTPSGNDKDIISFEIPKTSKATPEDDLSDGNSSDSHNDLQTEKIYEGATGISQTNKIVSKIPVNQDIPTIKKTDVKPVDLSWQCSICTLINTPIALQCSACSHPKPLTRNEISSLSEELKKFLRGETIKTSTANIKNDDKKEKVLLRPNEKKNDLNKTSPNRKSSDIFNIIEEVIKPIPKNLAETKINPIQRIVTVNFSSPNITKSKYRGVDNFNPYRKDINDKISPAINNNKKEVLPGSEVTANKQFVLKSPYSTSHYLELLKLDFSGVVLNTEQFECPICFVNVEKGHGVILRECLHIFCKECLSNTVKFNDEAQVKCPFMDKEYSCNSFLQEREIKSLVTIDIYEKHLAKSIKLAEHHIENAFHCKTANCRGWCIYEDNVNEFLCPVCNLKNCLTCRAIHDGLTCKQYQDRLNSDCDSNVDAKRTKDMLQEMVEKGEALNCPTCQVVMMKKWGCDWLKCSMCKTEVCWVTRGPRWGPAGKGDTSGGCKCGVNGVKCHPKCNFCH